MPFLHLIHEVSERAAVLDPRLTCLGAEGELLLGTVLDFSQDDRHKVSDKDTNLLK